MIICLLMFDTMVSGRIYVSLTSGQIFFQPLRKDTYYTSIAAVTQRPITHIASILPALFSQLITFNFQSLIFNRRLYKLISNVYSCKNETRCA